MDPDEEPQEVVEGEVTTPAVAGESGDASTLVTVTNLIQNYLAQINENKRLLIEHKQMVDDALNNDETYKKHSDAAKEAAKVKMATKKQLMQQPNLRELAEKIKDLTADMKAARESLSQYLQQYHQLTDSNQFEDGKGEVLDIVYVATLKRISNR